MEVTTFHPFPDQSQGVYPAGLVCVLTSPYAPISQDSIDDVGRTSIPELGPFSFREISKTKGNQITRGWHESRGRMRFQSS